MENGEWSGQPNAETQRRRGGNNGEVHALSRSLFVDSDGKGGIGYQVGVWRCQTPAWGRRAACAPRSWTDFTNRVFVVAARLSELGMVRAFKTVASSPGLPVST